MDTQKKEITFDIFMHALFAKIYELRPDRPIVFSKIYHKLHNFFAENVNVINQLLDQNEELLMKNSGDGNKTIPRLNELLDGWSLTGVLGNALQKFYSLRLTPEYCLQDVPRYYYNENAEQLEKIAQKFIETLMTP